MAARQNRASQPPQQSSGSARQNEYFVPRDGIDREVITADVCRYLGNDALVRPGTYEAPDGRVTQGYFITAYRNLTTAMIQDLKADSARWEQERRSSSRPAGGATGAPSARDPPRYHTSETHQNRQYYGPTSATDAHAPGGFGDAMAVDSYPAAPPPQARYPGTGNAGYYGVNSNNPPEPQPSYAPPPHSFNAPPQQGYAGYGSPQYQMSHAPADRFGPSPVVSTGPPPDSYVATGANYGAVSAPDYSSNRMMPSVAAPSRTPGYAQGPGGYGQDPNYYGSAPQSNYSQPMDAFYGRGQGGAYNTGTPISTSNQASDALGSPAAPQPNTGYSTLPDVKPTFTGQSQPPAPSSRTPVPVPGSADAQMANSGTPVSSAASRRDTERDARERTERTHRDRDRDREDRHANERREHRQRHR